MIRICSCCKKVIGQKEPLEDKSETHGICQECFKVEVAKLTMRFDITFDIKDKIDEIFMKEIDEIQTEKNRLERAKRDL